MSAPNDLQPARPDMQTALRDAASVLRSATSVAMACHVNPDADALGSMLGMSAFLRARGVKTVVSYPNEPLNPPRWVSFLPGSDALISPSKFPAKPEVMMTFDCAGMDRLGNLGTSAAAAKNLIWLDHHRSNPGHGSVSLIDPDASSTCEVVFRLIRAMDGELSADVAACLYAGLVTDTGKFQYEATTPETLRIAASLREFGFDHTRLVQALYEDNRPAWLALFGKALERMEEVPEADLAWAYLTQAEMAEAGVGPGESDDLIDSVRTARNVDVAAVFKQQRDGRFKVSVRSRGGHDLAVVAAAFGGGGHRLASGYTSSLGLSESVKALVAALVQQ